MKDRAPATCHLRKNVLILRVFLISDFDKSLPEVILMFSQFQEINRAMTLGDLYRGKGCAFSV